MVGFDRRSAVISPMRGGWAESRGEGEVEGVSRMMKMMNCVIIDSTYNYCIDL